MEFKANERVTGVTVVFTDKTTEITGGVSDGPDVLQSDFLVIAFPEDPAFWVPQFGQKTFMVTPYSVPRALISRY